MARNSLNRTKTRSKHHRNRAIKSIEFHGWNPWSLTTIYRGLASIVKNGPLNAIDVIPSMTPNTLTKKCWNLVSTVVRRFLAKTYSSTLPNFIFFRGIVFYELWWSFARSGKFCPSLAGWPRILRSCFLLPSSNSVFKEFHCMIRKWAHRISPLDGRLVLPIPLCAFRFRCSGFRQFRIELWAWPAFPAFPAAARWLFYLHLVKSFYLLPIMAWCRTRTRL